MNKKFCSACIKYVEIGHAEEMRIQWQEWIEIMNDWQKSYNTEPTDYITGEHAYVLSHTPHEVYPSVRFIIDAIIHIHKEVNKQ